MKKISYVAIALVAMLALVFGAVQARPAMSWSPLWSDGFESGDFSAWDEVHTTSGASLSVLSTGDCPYRQGTYCAKATGTSGSVAEQAYVRHDEIGENEYLITWFGQVSTTAGTGDDARIMAFRDATDPSVTIGFVQIAVSGSVHKARVQCMDNSSTWHASSWGTIPDYSALSLSSMAKFEVEFHSGASGYCSMLLRDLDTGGTNVSVGTGSLNNSDWSVGPVRLGTPRIPSNKTSTHYFDAVQSYAGY